MKSNINKNLCIIGKNVNIVYTLEAKLTASNLNVRVISKDDTIEQIAVETNKYNSKFVILVCEKEKAIHLMSFLMRNKQVIFIISEEDKIQNYPYSFSLKDLNIDEVIYKIIKIIKGKYVII